MAIVTRFSQAWLAIALVTLSGCAIAPLNSNRVSDAGTSIELPERIELPEAAESPAADESPAAADTETVRIYTIDAQCQWFQSETVALPKERTLEAAVGRVLAEQQNDDFDLSGYRVTTRPNGEVTIDFRLPPDSKRQMTSLSSCEQLALFGSLRQTLLRNPQWNVKFIRFTHRGNPIVL